MAPNLPSKAVSWLPGGFPSSIHRPFHSSLIFRATHSQRLQLELPSPTVGTAPRLFFQLLLDWPEDSAPKSSETLLSTSHLTLRTEHRCSLGAACSWPVLLDHTGCAPVGVPVHSQACRQLAAAASSHSLHGFGLPLQQTPT